MHLKSQPPLWQLQQQFRDVLKKRRNKKLDVLESHNFSKEERLGVYQYAYRARIWDSLEEDFPTVKELLGKKQFTALIKSYLEVYPSRYASLAEVSKNLPFFVTTYDCTLNQPQIIDAAYLDWLEIEVLMSREPSLSELLSSDEFERCIMQAKLALHPSVRLYQLRATSDMHMAQILWRHRGKIHRGDVSAMEYKFLNCIANGIEFSALAEKMVELELSESEVDRVLFKWTKQGIIIALRGQEGGKGERTVA